MVRLVTVVVAGLALMTFAGFAALSGPVDAQDNTNGRLGGLETQVANQATEVTGLRKRVKRLEGVVLTPRAEAEQAARSETASEGDGASESEPQPTNTPRPVASGPVGTRDNPVPVGTAADVGGGWTIAVTDVIPNGTDLVMAENQFNEPPDEGRQFFIVTVAATYSGEESTVLPFSVTFSAVGQTNVAYQSFEDDCGVIPNEVPTSEVFPGGTVEGNICWSIRGEDVDSLVMFTDAFISFDDEDRVYFSLRPES